MAAIGVDGNGDKHVLAVVEGATENTVVVQALLDNLLARGLDPTLPRLFIVDGAKALSKAIRNTSVGAAMRCGPQGPEHHRALLERQEGAPSGLGPGRRRRAERLTWPGDSMGGRLGQHPGDEILTVIRLGLPHELPAPTSKRWRNAEMALRWTAAGLLEAQKTFRRLKAYRQLHPPKCSPGTGSADSAIETIMKAA